MTEALSFAVIAVAAAAGAHVMVSTREASGDVGGFWAQVLDRLVIWIGLPVLVLSCVHRVPVFGWLPRDGRIWLAIPAAAFLGLLALGYWRVPEPIKGRWIAGTLEFSPRRFWVLLFALPFLPAVYAIAPPWSDAQDQIYAAHWALLVLFLVTLIGIAFSAFPMAVPSGLGGRGAITEDVPLPPDTWRQEMESRGVQLERIADWEPARPAGIPLGPAAEWHRRLSLVSPGIPTGLCEAVTRLVSWEPRVSDPVAFVLGPDHCGQEEITALLAAELSRRHGETTLVITPTPDAALARRFAMWLTKFGGENPVSCHDMSTAIEAPLPGTLVLTDAETLSESVLDKLRMEVQQHRELGDRRGSLGRIGVVVWWNAHEFSGVLAAHVWAVSRRLERLLQSGKRLPTRALVFARPPATAENYERIATDPNKKLLGFLEYLLPYAGRLGDLDTNNTFTIPSTFSRRTHLYSLKSESRSESIRRASEESLLMKWPTLPPPDVVPLLTARDVAVTSPADAAARIFELRPNELLSLPEILCQGGRSSPAGLEHHAALATDGNAYSDFVLSHLQRLAGERSVNLVSPQGHPELLKRHLLLALREVPETLTGLLRSFHWEEALLREILGSLSAAKDLNAVPVRFLDDRGRLQRDFRYSNQSPAEGAIRSFRIVGSHPVDVRDPNVQNRLLKQVDRERLPIDAYPLRTFWSEGHRYRVQPWSGEKPARIDCRFEGDDVQTWRRSARNVRLGARVGASQMYRGLECYRARVRYSENVWGVLERDKSGAFRTLGVPGVGSVRTEFETEALVVELVSAFDLDAVLSAVAALSEVLAVHAGVDEDTLDVVPVEASHHPTIALVDLHPGGIGIVEALQREVWLIPRLFNRVVDWLSQLDESAAGKLMARSPRLQSLGLTSLDVPGALRLLESVSTRGKWA